MTDKGVLHHESLMHGVVVAVSNLKNKCHKMKYIIFRYINIINRYININVLYI